MSTPSHPQPPASRPPLRGVLLAAGLGSMAMMTFVALVGPIVRRFALPESVAGLAVTVGGVCWMCTARRWGQLGDRIGRKPVLRVGFAAFAIAYAVLAIGVLAANHWSLAAGVVAAVLIVTRALIGAFYAAVPPTAAAFIADHTTPAARPAAMARLGSANALGMVLGPALAGILAGWQLGWAIGAAAVLPLVALVAVQVAVPAAPAPVHRGAQPAATLALLDPRLRLACVAGFLGMTAVAIAQVLVGFVAMDRWQLGADDGARVAGWALTAVGLALMLAQQGVARWRTVPPARWITLGASVAGGGFASATLASTPALLVGCYATMALGMGLVLPNVQALVANAVAPHEQGAAAGTLSAAQGLGMVVGPLAGTLLYGLGPGWPYLAVAAALWALALYMWWRRLAPAGQPQSNDQQYT